MYAQTTVKVRVNESFSDSWRICRGVRQRGVTSAFLFNIYIYIDDILSSISNFKVGCFLGFERDNIQAYADDIVLLSLTVSSLQFLINKMSEMSDKLELSINVRKTVARIFNRNLNRVNKDVQIFYKDDGLNVVSAFKYLRCFLKPDLCEDIYMDRLNLSFKRNLSFGFLLRIFYFVDIGIFYSLFDSYCS